MLTEIMLNKIYVGLYFDVVVVTKRSFDVVEIIR